jgi:DNA-binding beta-propeller fold protein YncE
LVLVLVGTLFADEVADSRKLYRDAAAAYKAKDYATFLTKMRAASDLRPQHAGFLYNVAAALALNGRTDEALDTLDRVAAMGMAFNPAKDEDFASLRENSRFTQIAEAFARNAMPKKSVTPVFSIDDRGIISEGIAHDAKTGRFFVSSVRNGAIYARDRKGKVTTFLRDVPWGIFGMAVDSSRRRLWAAASVMPQSAGFHDSNGDRGAVLEIDADSGKILRTITPAGSEKHLFGDVAVARDGTVFVSDSMSPSIYRVSNGSIEPFIAAGPFASLQGLAISTDGHVLYASDYSRGIDVIDLTTRDVHLLPVPPGVTLLGVDGLYAAGKGILIGTQNGTNPQRILRIQLAPGGLSVANVDVLASNEAEFDDITLGVLVDDRLYFNGVAQWALFGDDGKPPDASKLKPALVLRVPVSGMRNR